MFEKDPRTFSPEYKNLSPEQKAMVKLEISLSRFFKHFDNSVRRWERMIYPAIFVFGLLGLSGFYLIYHVTKDMHSMSQSFDPAMESNMAQMAHNINELSKNIAVMTGQLTLLVKDIRNMDDNIAKMGGNIGEITVDIHEMLDDTGAMARNISTMNDSIERVTLDVAQMNQSMRAMTLHTGLMGRDMRQMNKPMRVMNAVMPW
ncbi:MAG TPA: hypothetical protein EYP90_07345 [Chromatiaceae bacterium]|nr:hypothetical protein [Chromatiaceae bacterium]